MKTFYTIVVIAVIALLGLAIGFNINQPEKPLSGVTAGNEYQSLTTRATTTFAYLFYKGAGTFGSVVINTLGTGNVVFYDATSTNSNLRTVTATTSLPVIAVIDASQAAGTYVYDTTFNGGLMAVYSGAQGTSTTMWRK